LLSALGRLRLGGPIPASEMNLIVMAELFLWAGYLICLNGWSTRQLKSGFREAATDRFSVARPMAWFVVFGYAWRFVAIVVVLCLFAVLWAQFSM
jgi:hypothetical protein